MFSTAQLPAWQTSEVTSGPEVGSCQGPLSPSLQTWGGARAWCGTWEGVVRKLKQGRHDGQSQSPLGLGCRECQPQVMLSCTLPPGRQAPGPYQPHHGFQGPQGKTSPWQVTISCFEEPRKSLCWTCGDRVMWMSKLRHNASWDFPAFGR